MHDHFNSVGEDFDKIQQSLIIKILNKLGRQKLFLNQIKKKKKGIHKTLQLKLYLLVKDSMFSPQSVT